jgi:hypothetical protein
MLNKTERVTDMEYKIFYKWWMDCDIGTLRWLRDSLKQMLNFCEKTDYDYKSRQQEIENLTACYNWRTQKSLCPIIVCWLD